MNGNVSAGFIKKNNSEIQKYIQKKKKLYMD